MLEINSMNVMSVIKPLHLTGLFKCIKDHTVKINSMNVISMVKHLHV